MTIATNAFSALHGLAPASATTNAAPTSDAAPASSGFEAAMRTLLAPMPAANPFIAKAAVPTTPSAGPSLAAAIPIPSAGLPQSLTTLASVAIVTLPPQADEPANRVDIDTPDAPATGLNEPILLVPEKQAASAILTSAQPPLGTPLALPINDETPEAGTEGSVDETVTTDAAFTVAVAHDPMLPDDARHSVEAATLIPVEPIGRGTQPTSAAISETNPVAIAPSQASASTEPPPGGVDGAPEPALSPPAQNAGTGFAERVASIGPGVSAAVPPTEATATPSQSAIATASANTSAVTTTQFSPARIPSDVPTIVARPGRIGREMGVEIARRVSAGGEELTVRLNPAEMGRIEVRLSFDERGSLRAVVAAESAAALEMLRRDHADLGRALADAGVRADAQSFRFDSRSGQNEAGQPWQRQQGSGQRRGPHQDASPSNDELDPAYRPLRASGRIDLMA